MTQPRWRKSFAVIRRLLSPEGWFLSLRVLAFASLVPLLSRLRLPTLASVLEPNRIARRVANEEDVERLQAAVDLALRIGPPLVRPVCLTRVLTLYYFLRRRGVELDLCFGMGNPGKDFAGHCWLERDDAPFLEPEDPRETFVVMYRVSSSPVRPESDPGLPLRQAGPHSPSR